MAYIGGLLPGEGDGFALSFPGAVTGAVADQGGIVAGIACVCIEVTPRGKALPGRYGCSTAVIPGADYQAQCYAERLDFVETFDRRSILPDSPEATSAQTRPRPSTSSG